MLTTTVAGRTFNFSHAVGQQAFSGNGFTYPVGICLAESDTVYVISRANEMSFAAHTSKLRIGAPGEEEIQAEFGWYGQDDGQTTWPCGVSVDKSGNVYVSDEWLNRISIFNRNGDFVSKWGIGGSGDGELDGPSGLAFDSRENLYVVDSRNHRVQKFSKYGRFLGKWGSPGSGQGELNCPWGITVDKDDYIYVADWKNHRVQKFSKEGALVRQYGSGPGDGVGELNHPTDVAVDQDGDVYVVDWANSRVQIYSCDGEFLTSLIGDAQQLSKWAQMTIDANPDYFKARRRVKTLEPEWRFTMPTAIIYDPATRRIIIMDTQRGRMQIYKKEENYSDPQANL